MTENRQKPTSRMQKHEELLREAMKQPGVKEVMDVYNATLQIEEIQAIQVVPQEVHIRFASDNTRAMV